MTVIRPNSVSGINSITAQANEIKIFKSDGTQGGLVIGGANLNATSGISTVAALNVTGNVSVGGTLTYQDVTNIDSVGIITARAGVNISGGNLQVGGTNVINSGRVLYNLEQLKLSDTKEIVLGSGNDLKIYHSGSHSFISEEGAGALKIKGDDIRFEDAGGTEALRIDSGGRIAQGGRTPTNHGSPNLLLWGADPTLHISATGSTANTSFAGIKFAVAGGSTGDYSKAGIFVQRQDSYNDLDMIFAFRSSNDATGVSVSDEKIRINSDGFVGINESSPSSFLDVSRGTSDGVLSILKNDEVSIQIGVWGTGSSYARECTINATRQDGGSYPRLRLAGQDGIRFASDLNNVRGNINAYGEFRIGTGNDNLYSTDQVHSIGNLNFSVTSNLARLVMQERQNNWISFKDGSSNHYGTISRSGSNVAYGGQSSDYRIKENVVGVSTGIDMVKQLRPVHFNYTADSGFSEEEQSVVEIGFIAHEFSEVCPHGVIGEKDAYEILGDCVDNTTGETTQLLVPESQAKDGETWTETSREPKYQQIDFSKQYLF